MTYLNIYEILDISVKEKLIWKYHVTGPVFMLWYLLTVHYIRYYKIYQVGKIKYKKIPKNIKKQEKTTLIRGRYFLTYFFVYSFLKF
jgi:hypothetical protein